MAAGMINIEQESEAFGDPIPIKGVEQDTQPTVMILNFRTNKIWQTVQTKLLQEQSDQGLHCLIFYLHLLEELLHG